MAQRLNDLADFLSTSLLHAGCESATLFLGEFGGISWKACFLPKLGGENEPVVHSVSQVATVQPQRAVRGRAQHIAEHFAVLRLAPKAQPLGLVLLRVGSETKDLGDSGIEPSQRVRIRDVAQLTKARAFANGDHTGPSVSLLVHGDDQSAFVPGKKESAGDVAEMVFDVRDLFDEASAGLMPELAQVAELAGQSSDFTNLGVTGGEGIKRGSSCASDGAPHPSAQRSSREGNAVYALPTRSRFR